MNPQAKVPSAPIRSPDTNSHRLDVVATHAVAMPQKGLNISRTPSTTPAINPAILFLNLPFCSPIQRTNAKIANMYVERFPTKKSVMYGSKNASPSTKSGQGGTCSSFFAMAQIENAASPPRKTESIPTKTCFGAPKITSGSGCSPGKYTYGKPSYVGDLELSLWGLNPCSVTPAAAKYALIS